MLDEVRLTYKREGEKYVGLLEYKAKLQEFKAGLSFAEMMMETHRILVQTPEGTPLRIIRAERPNALPVQLEAKLLHQLRVDPEGYIKANTIAPRIIDMRAERISALANSDRYAIPRNSGLRHGLNVLADAFGETVYAKAKPHPGGWRFEHPATGRWVDLNTIERWLGTHDTEIYPLDEKGGWLLLKTAQLLNTDAERFYFPREWNEFGSWISKDQLREKLDQFRKDKTDVTRK